MSKKTGMTFSSEIPENPTPSPSPSESPSLQATLEAETQSQSPQASLQAPLSDNPSSPVPNPLKIRRKRGPNKLKPPASEPITLQIQPEAFLPLAAAYSALLSTVLPPELSDPECRAIADAMAAVAAKYGPGFQHWELAALAGAMLTPVMVRYIAKSKQEPKPKLSVVNAVP